MNEAKITGEVLPEAEHRMITDATLIKVGERYYETKSIIPAKFSVSVFGMTPTAFADTVFSFADPETNLGDYVYLIGDFYYMYRGKLSDQKGFDELKPGIYYDDDKCKFVICNPETEEEIEEYRYADKIVSKDADDIRNAILNREVVIYNFPESSHSAIPPESIDDDILKRLIKRALAIKGIDLDQCKARFASKNMLFNFKSVLRGDSRLSMLLFERGAEALNLKYTIVFDEIGDEIIGKPLVEPLALSSDDVFTGSYSTDSANDDEVDEDETDL